MLKFMVLHVLIFKNLNKLFIPNFLLVIVYRFPDPSPRNNSKATQEYKSLMLIHIYNQLFRIFVRTAAMFNT